MSAERTAVPQTRLGSQDCEDGPHDITSELTVPSDLTGTAVIEFRSAGIVAGSPYADAVAEECDWRGLGGSHRRTIASLWSSDRHLVRQSRAVLRAERPMLNLLQRASGIATLTRTYVDAIEGTRAGSCTLGRLPPAYASRRARGAGRRRSGHRLDLAQEVMVKDNHWRAIRAETGIPLADAIDNA